MLSVIRRGIIIGIIVALSGGILLPAAAQDGAQAVTELREQSERFPADAEIAGQLPGPCQSLL